MIFIYPHQFGGGPSQTGTQMPHLLRVSTKEQSAFTVITTVVTKTQITMWRLSKFGEGQINKSYSDELVDESAQTLLNTSLLSLNTPPAVTGLSLLTSEWMHLHRSGTDYLIYRLSVCLRICLLMFFGEVQTTSDCPQCGMEKPTIRGSTEQHILTWHFFSKTHKHSSYSVSAWSLQCGQRVMNTMERKQERREGEWGWRRVRGWADRTGDEGEGGRLSWCLHRALSHRLSPVSHAWPLEPGLAFV